METKRHRNAPRTTVDRLASLAKSTLPIVNLGVSRVTGRKSPFQMTYSLTNRCNFRCEYCNIPLQHRDEMSTEEWFRATDELLAGGMGRVSLIGGEPLLRKDFGEIVRYLKQKGLHVAMNTNGWLVPSRIEDVALLDVVCITLDGPKELHDRQRHAGSYDKAIQAIELLQARGIPVVTMTVVTPQGADAVDHVLDVARRMDFKAHFQLEHNANCDVNAPISPDITDERVARLAQHLRQRKSDGWPVGNSRTILQAQEKARYIGTCSDCYAGQYYGYIFSDGTVAPCLFTQRQVQNGNGRTQGFLNAFHALKEPEGPGCSCLPTHQVNAILDFDVSVLWHALDMAVGPARLFSRAAE